MLGKIWSILGSIRFWIITLAWLSSFLVKVETDGFTIALLLSQISLWLGTVAGVGTLDKLAMSIRK